MSTFSVSNEQTGIMITDEVGRQSWIDTTNDYPAWFKLYPTAIKTDVFTGRYFFYHPTTFLDVYLDEHSIDED